MKSLRLEVCLIAVTLMSAKLMPASSVVYSINLSGQFGVLDISNGTFTPIGPGVPDGLTGLGGNPGGPFFSVDAANGHWIRIAADGTVADLGDTGTGSSVGPTGVSISGSLATGAQYGLSFSNDLLRFDPPTGAVTDLGQLGIIGVQDSAYAGNMFTSLAGNATDLFLTLEILSGPNQIPPTLYDINPLTLAVKCTPVFGIVNIIGSGWINGQLIGFTGNGEIVSIDTSTGVATVTSAYDAGIPPGGGPPMKGIFGAVDSAPVSALAPASVPEPATGALGIGGLALIFIRLLRK